MSNSRHRQGYTLFELLVLFLVLVGCAYLVVSVFQWAVFSPQEEISVVTESYLEPHWQVENRIYIVHGVSTAKPVRVRRFRRKYRQFIVRRVGYRIFKQPIPYNRAWHVQTPTIQNGVRVYRYRSPQLTKIARYQYRSTLGYKRPKARSWSRKVNHHRQTRRPRYRSYRYRSPSRSSTRR